MITSCVFFGIGLGFLVTGNILIGAAIIFITLCAVVATDTVSDHTED